MALPQQEMLKEYRDRLQALARGADQGGGTAAGNQGTKDAAGEKIQVTPYVWGSGPAPTFPKAAAASAPAAQPVPQAGQGVSAQEAKTVSQARDYLQGVISGGSGGYRSDYTGQIADLYDQIMNRPKFQYDVNRDPLFQQYKNQYMVNGQRAMQDAMGQAAALTGGYGSSWGNTAGYQAYQQYLQMLNDRVPELEQRAFDRYAYEGDQMRQNMDLTLNLDNIDYSRYRDKVQDWKDDRAFSYGAYRDTMGDWQSQRAFDYGMYRDAVGDYLNERNFGWNMYDAEANREMKNYWNSKNYQLNVKKFLASLAKESK
jgi:hypothetical protein